MKIEKIGDMLAVVIPVDVANALGLSEGDMVEVRPTPDPEGDRRRAAAIEQIQQLARPLPDEYRFDRDEANAR